MAKQRRKKKIDWRRILVTALALLMVLAMVLPLLGGLFSGAHAVTQAQLKDQISGLKSDAQQAEERKANLERERQAVAKDKDRAMDEWRILSEQLYTMEEQIKNTQDQIDAYTALIAAQEEALTEAQGREDAAYARFCRRARSMEESGAVSYWSVLFAARSYSDLLDRLALVDEIMTYDNMVVNDLAAARADVEDTLAELNSSRDELDLQKAAQDAQRDELDTKAEQAQGLLDQLKSQEKNLADLIAAEEAELKKIDAAMAKKEKELEELIRKANFTTGSDWFYPLPSERTYVTSRFGPRSDPITGESSNHTGMDIPAPSGTPIYAAQGGVVNTSAYAPASYGNYVAISHGNGVVTLYAHMSKRAVKEGQTVDQGQIIGYVGTTGRSTGNHLHLELRINNVRQDPEQMFPKVNFTYKYNW